MTQGVLNQVEHRNGATLQATAEASEVAELKRSIEQLEQSLVAIVEYARRVEIRVYAFRGPAACRVCKGIQVPELPITEAEQQYHKYLHRAAMPNADSIHRH
jgi:hypothetical protein